MSVCLLTIFLTISPSPSPSASSSLFLFCSGVIPSSPSSLVIMVVGALTAAATANSPLASASSCSCYYQQTSRARARPAMVAAVAVYSRKSSISHLGARCFLSPWTGLLKHLPHTHNRSFHGIKGPFFYPLSPSFDFFFACGKQMKKKKINMHVEITYVYSSFGASLFTRLPYF